MMVVMIRGLFSHDLDYNDYTTRVTKLGFYGNDGVCLFKYFVKRSDPQKTFVWTIIAINFLCFIFISISYVAITCISQRSSKNVSNTKANKQSSNRTKKMNQRIAFIITTDFVCWVPFIIICILHSAEVLDGTPWYSIFSIFFLPLNSVINPLIYDDTVPNLIAAPVKKIANLVSGSAVFQSLRDRWSSAKQEDIELEHVAQVQEGEAAGTIAKAESEKRKREGVLSDAN